MLVFKNVFNRAKVDRVFMWWLALLIVSLFGMIFNLVYCITQPGVEDINGEHLLRGGDQERWTYPFYFTNQSNLLVVIVSFVIVFIKKVSQNSIHFKRIKIMMFVNITLTMFVYFGALFPSAIKDLQDGSRSVESFTSTFFVHLITPALAIFVFVFDSIKTRANKLVDYKLTIPLNAIYPILWLSTALIYYYSFGGQSEDAIYSFLDMNSGLTIPLIYIFGIAFAYIGLTILGIFVINKQVK